MNKSLITGGRGQDAQLLGIYLSSIGEQAFFTTRDEQLSNKTNYFYLDPRDFNLEEKIIDILNKNDINRIFHLASQNTSSERTNDNIEDLYNSNILFTESILNAALLAKNEIKVLVAGTCHQFSPKKEGSIKHISTSTKESPRNLYGLTKSVNRLQVSHYRKLGLFACFTILFNHETNRLTVGFDDLSIEGQPLYCELYDMLGKQLVKNQLSSEQTYLSITESLCPGVYLLKVTNQNNKTIKALKFIKN